MTSSERWIWKLLSWRLDILPAKFRSTADTSENLLSINPINPCTKTIFGEGTNAVAGEYLGSIRSCQRLEKFSCKQSRGYTAGFAGYRGIWKGHTAKIIWQKFKIGIKKCFFGEWRQSLSCSNPSFGHPQLQIRWSGTGISTRFALLVSIHANLEHFKGFLHDSQQFWFSKNQKYTKLTICTYFAVFAGNWWFFAFNSSYGSEGFSSPSVPPSDLPMEGWPLPGKLPFSA